MTKQSCRFAASNRASSWARASMTVGCCDVVPADPLAVAVAERSEPQRRGVQAAAEQQVRHGADPHRVVAALDRLGERAVEVLERLARAGADVPGEVPQGDGQPLGEVGGDGTGR